MDSVDKPVLLPLIIYKLFDDPFYFNEQNPAGYPSTTLRTLAICIGHTINTLIIVATGALCMETMDDYNPKKPGNEDWQDTWDTLEIICVTLFSLDFAIRLVGAGASGNLRVFWKDALNYIDLFAILPFYLALVFGKLVDLRFFRVVRLVRVLRALRDPRFGNMGNVILSIFSESAGALAIPMYFMNLALVMFACFVYFVELSYDSCSAIHRGERAASTQFIELCEAVVLDGTGRNASGHVLVGDGLPKSLLGSYSEEAQTANRASCQSMHQPASEQCDDSNVCLPLDHCVYTVHPTTFQSIPAALWWCATTLTTVGYGDMYPVTVLGRMATVLVMASGIFFLAMPLTIVGSAFNDEWEDITRKKQRAVILRHRQGLPKVKQEQIDIQHIEQHVERLSALLTECERIAPDGEHWADLEHSVAVLHRTFENCKSLYTTEPSEDENIDTVAKGNGELEME